MKRLWLTLVTTMAVTAATGCGAAGKVGGGTTTTSATSVAPTATAAPRFPAGKVTSVHDVRVTVDGVVAGDGAPVLSAGTVASDANGSFDLSVGATVHRCMTDHDSTLQVRPDPTLLISWTQGTSWCEKSGGAAGRFGIGPGLVATMKDPVFRVTVDSSRTVLKVDKGFVSVQGPGAAVTVGPSQQVEIPAGGPPGPAQPMAPDALDNVNFGPLEKLTPRPDFSRPKSGVSAGVDGVLRGGLNIAMFTAGDGFNEHSSSFFRTYMTTVARHWDVSITSSYVGTREATVPGPTPDVVLEAVPGSGSGGTVVPLFTDGTDTWQLAARDTGLADALRKILIAELNSGDYDTLFTQTFGHQPDYQPVADLVLSS